MITLFVILFHVISLHDYRFFLEVRPIEELQDSNGSPRREEVGRPTLGAIGGLLAAFFYRGKTFYILMERGKDVAFGKKLNKTYLSKLKDESGFRGIERYEVEKIHNENRYFILVKATPVMADSVEKSGT